MQRKILVASGLGISAVVAAAVGYYAWTDSIQTSRVATPEILGYPGIGQPGATEAYPSTSVDSEVTFTDKKQPYPGPNVDLKPPTPTPMLGVPDALRPGWRRYQSEAGFFAMSFPENSYASPSGGYGDRQELQVTVPGDGTIPPLSVVVASLPTGLADDAVGRLVEIGFSSEKATAQDLLDRAERVEIGGQEGYLISMPERGMEPVLFILGLPNRVLYAYRGSRSVLSGVAEENTALEERWWEVVSTLQMDIN